MLTTNAAALDVLMAKAAAVASLKVGHYIAPFVKHELEYIIECFEEKINYYKNIRNKPSHMFFYMGAHVAAVRELKSWDAVAQPKEVAKKLNALVRQYKLKKIVMTPMVMQFLREYLSEFADYNFPPEVIASNTQAELIEHAKTDFDNSAKTQEDMDKSEAMRMAADVIQSWLDQDEKPISQYIHEVLCGK